MILRISLRLVVMISFFSLWIALFNKKAVHLPRALVGRTALFVSLNSIPKSASGSSSRVQLINDQLQSVLDQGATLLIVLGNNQNQSVHNFASELNSLADSCHRQSVDIAAEEPKQDESKSKIEFYKMAGLDAQFVSSNLPKSCPRLYWLGTPKKTQIIPVNDHWLSTCIQDFQNWHSAMNKIPKLFQEAKQGELITSSPFKGSSYFKECHSSELVAELGLVSLFFQQGMPALFYGDEFGLVTQARVEKLNAFPPDPSQYDQKLQTLATNLIHLRQNRPSLARGDFSILFEDAERGIIVAVRKYRFEYSLLFLNLSHRQHEVRINFPSLSANSIQDLLGGAVFNSTALGIDIDLPAQGYALLGTTGL